MLSHWKSSSESPRPLPTYPWPKSWVVWRMLKGIWRRFWSRLFYGEEFIQRKIDAFRWKPSPEWPRQLIVAGRPPASPEPSRKRNANKQIGIDSPVTVH